MNKSVYTFNYLNDELEMGRVFNYVIESLPFPIIASIAIWVLAAYLTKRLWLSHLLFLATLLGSIFYYFNQGMYLQQLKLNRYLENSDKVLKYQVAGLFEYESLGGEHARFKLNNFTFDTRVGRFPDFCINRELSQALREAHEKHVEIMFMAYDQKNLAYLKQTKNGESPQDNPLNNPSFKSLEGAIIETCISSVNIVEHVG